MPMFQHTHPVHGLLPINISAESVEAMGDEQLIKNVLMYRDMKASVGMDDSDPSAGYLRLMEALVAERGLTVG